MHTEWKDTLLTGITEIDSENKEFFEKFNQLLKACEKGEGKDEVVNVLKYLDYYVNFHLDIEEKHIRRYGYLKSIQHCAMHDIFRSNFNSLKKEFKYEGIKMFPILKLNHMLINWLVNHVNRDDVELAEFFREKNGIKLK